MPKIKPSPQEERRRRLQRESALRKQTEDDALAELKEHEGGAPVDYDLPPLAEESEEVEEVEKFIDSVPMASSGSPTGAVTFDQLDEQRAAEKKSWMIQDESWDVRQLVRNIVNNPMLEPQEKGTFIKQVGSDFGDRVTVIMDTPAKMLKESPMEVLEIEALLAKDARKMGFIEKHAGTLYPKKQFIRKSLKEAADAILNGGEGAEKALESLPELQKEAKALGIVERIDEGSKKGGLLIQKDAQGDWRWVGWPSNNFKDRSSDILTEAAHMEYVEHWNKSREDQKLPVFTSMHAPLTVRESPVDFVGYENGFLVMSGKLTESEATGLLRIQKEYDLGMSHTGWGLRGDPDDQRLITKYRLFEVTDLPVEMADNPFAAVSVISQEVVMSKQQEKKQLEYLTKLLGDEDKAKQALSEKTSLKQAELQVAGVEQKEAKPEITDETKGEKAADLSPEIIDRISKALGLEDLSETIADLQNKAEMTPVLEGIIKKQAEAIEKLGVSQDELLEDVLTPPAQKRFAWQKGARSSESDENLASEEEVKKAKGPDNWLSEQTGTEPIYES